MVNCLLERSVALVQNEHIGSEAYQPLALQIGNKLFLYQAIYAALYRAYQYGHELGQSPQLYFDNYNSSFALNPPLFVGAEKK